MAEPGPVERQSSPRTRYQEHTSQPNDIVSASAMQAIDLVVYRPG